MESDKKKEIKELFNMLYKCMSFGCNNYICENKYCLKNPSNLFEIIKIDLDQKICEMNKS